MKTHSIDDYVSYMGDGDGVFRAHIEDIDTRGRRLQRIYAMEHASDQIADFNIGLLLLAVSKEDELIGMSLQLPHKVIDHAMGGILTNNICEPEDYGPDAKEMGVC